MSAGAEWSGGMALGGAAPAGGRAGGPALARWVRPPVRPSAGAPARLLSG